MKSKPLGTAKTNCKDCVLAVYDGDAQVGCLANRIATFKKRGQIIEAYDEDKEFYVIDRLCNFYRNQDWNHANTDDKLTTVSQECEPTIGLVIYDTQSRDSQIYEAIRSLQHIDYDKDKIKIVISSFHLCDVEKLVHATEELKSHGFHVVLTLNVMASTKHSIDFNAFKKCIGYGYLAKMEHDSIMPENLFKVVHDSLNVALEQIILFDYKKICMMPFAVVDTEYLKYNDYHLMIESIRPAAKQNNMYKQIS